MSLPVVTEVKDRVAIFCDFKNADYDQRDSTLLAIVDYIRCFLFPYIDSNPSNNIAGYDGDPVYIRLPFRVSNDSTKAPLLTSAKIQILATKTGKTDFVLEEKIFDTSAIRLLFGAQDINLEDDKRYIYGEDEAQFTEMSLIRDSGYDAAGMLGYLLTYPFILRYEFWAQALQLAESADTDVAEETQALTQQWSNYTLNGWSLKLRVSFEVKNTVTGHTTKFYTQTSITEKQVGQTPDTPPVYSSEIKYFIYDDSLNFVETNGILIGGRTLVRYIVDGDFSTMPTGTTASYGYIFADLQNTGGSTNRRFASTEYQSESDSPWSLPTPNEFGDGPTSTYTNGNVRKNTYGTTRVIFEAWYDDTKQKWTDARPLGILIYSRMGFWVPNELRQFSDGDLHQWSDNEQAYFAP